MMGLLCCCVHDETDENFDDNSPDIKDLNKIIKKRAWDTFLYYRKQQRKRKGLNCSWRKSDDKFMLVCDWSCVKFIQEETKFYVGDKLYIEGVKGHDDAGNPVSHVIFKSVFENKSDLVQEHSLRVERQTTSSCKSSVTKGYTTGFNVGLSIAAPSGIAKAAVGFSEGFSVDNVIENVDNKTLTWTAEGNIKVGSHSTIEATMHINEYHRPFKFTTLVAGKGNVKISILNRKKQCVYEINDDLCTVIHEEYPDDMKIKVGDTTCMIVEGNCEFQYGIEQGISIRRVGKVDATVDACVGRKMNTI